ncbi:glycosyltransferase [Candidatus Microgenomates bacterium]|nr:MAG: glycosyltransferase [Candidatus Microgenomates bacterium]
MKKAISLVIPTLNEEKNIRPLVLALDQALSRAHIPYELIFIDDHSHDQTMKVVSRLSRRYPIRFFTKKGMMGKAFSLLEGFKRAKFPIVGMIDADLQYPPSVLPKMVAKLTQVDIVVADRKKKQHSLLRQFLSFGFEHFFGRILHGLNCDVQSGLKVFKKEILKKVVLTPSAWTFDLEFLVKARRAGYRIDTVAIPFRKRTQGKSKVSFIKATIEIGTNALKLKLTNETVPQPKKRQTKQAAVLTRNREFEYKKKLDQNASAYVLLTPKQKMRIVLVLTVFAIVAYFSWHLSLFLLISLLSYLYFIDLIFNLVLIYRSFAKKPEIVISGQDLKHLKVLPKYTILCPLYNEAKVLPQFIESMEALSYPKRKLQILLVLESDDRETIDYVRAKHLPAHFQTVVVPDSLPKTKPKACNYALSRAKGEFIVIYDAEDKPDHQQLKKAVRAFQKTDVHTVCVQAKLNFYNSQQNLLTRLFAAEYAVWFEMILTGLQSLNAPIPLGGTSNHFRTKTLRDLGGWDAFNVTEDADLGIRLSKYGFKTAILESETLEEANSEIVNWFGQRSRWIKGYMQTYLVHSRSDRQRSSWNPLKRMMFELVIGGKVLSMLVNPIMWLMTIGYFAFRASVGGFIESLFIPATFYIAVFSLVIGNFLYLYYYMIGIAKRNEWSLAIFTLLTPIYWLFMSVAAVRALYELLVRPHHWHKTKHGLHIVGDRPKRFAFGLSTRKIAFAGR